MSTCATVNRVMCNVLLLRRYRGCAVGAGDRRPDAAPGEGCLHGAGGRLGAGGGHQGRGRREGAARGAGGARAHQEQDGTCARTLSTGTVDERRHVFCLDNVSTIRPYANTDNSESLFYLASFVRLYKCGWPRVSGPTLEFLFKSCGLIFLYGLITKSSNSSDLRY